MNQIQRCIRVVLSVSLVVITFASSFAEAHSPAPGVSRFSNINYPAVFRPLDHVCTDLNGDGAPDTAVVSKYGRLEVRFGVGEGVFSDATEYFVGLSAARIIAADLNADLSPDLVITNDEQDEISVLINDGYGRFDDRQVVECFGGPMDLVAFDVDQDTDLDLAITCFGRDEVRIFENVDGVFRESRSFGVGDGPSRIVSADVNQDSIPDLIVSNRISRNINVYIQRSGRFYMSQRIHTGLNTHAIAVGDLDQDGDVDLASVGSMEEVGDELRVYNNDNGFFVLPVIHELGNHPIDLVVSQVNNDGFCDLVIAVSDQDHIDVRINDGKGGFDESQKFYLGHDPRSLALADMDGDQDLDLSIAVLFQSTSYTQSIENDGAGGFHSFKYALPFTTSGAPILFDLNLDTHDDVVWSEQGRIAVRLADGHGGYGQPTYFATRGHQYISLFLDLDHDGYPDIVSVDWDEYSVWVHWNESGDAFLQSTLTLEGYRASEFQHHDVDLDGYVDLLMSGYGNDDRLLLNKGNRSFQVRELEGVTGLHARVALYDLDGDRDLDLLRTNGTWIWRYENNGDGVYREVSLVFVGSLNEIHTADFDADGVTELLLFTSDGMFQCDYLDLDQIELTPVWTYGEEVRYGDLEFQDLDGDGDLDVLQSASYTARVLTNTGAGAFRTGAWFSIPYGVLRFNDHDDDGDLDLFGGQQFATGLLVVENLYETGCLADLDLDRIASFADVTLFIELYVTNRPGADLNRDGALDAVDVLDFLQAYANGCSE